jgi:predicted nucleic acid-binding protein
MRAVDTNVLVRLITRDDTRQLTAAEAFVQDHEVVAAALDLFLQRPRRGFSDCLVIEVARKAGHLPLGTFDRDVGKVPGAQKLGPPRAGEFAATSRRLRPGPVGDRGRLKHDCGMTGLTRSRPPCTSLSFLNVTSQPEAIHGR